MVTSAPGRVDFLNTHQDYKHLPVVPLAINLRTYAIAVDEVSDKFIVESINLKEEGEPFRDEFSLNFPKPKLGKWFGNYLRGVVYAFNELKGVSFEKGLKVVISSEVPIGSGLASSAALEVSFAKLVSEYFGIRLSVEDLAEIAFYAENVFSRIPCGRLDQYSSAYGGAIVIYFRPTLHVEKLPVEDIPLVIADSGVRHSVADIHPKRQLEINNGLKQLLQLNLPSKLREKIKGDFRETLWEEINLNELKPFLEQIDRTSAKRILFTLLMNESTYQALGILRRRKLSKEALKQLGEIVNYQHELLRDLYEVSIPRIEKIRQAMLDAGAYGVKISGAGMGGSLLAIAENPEDIKKAALRAGASKAYVLKLDEGARVEVSSKSYSKI